MKKAISFLFFAALAAAQQLTILPINWNSANQATFSGIFPANGAGPMVQVMVLDAADSDSLTVTIFYRTAAAKSLSATQSAIVASGLGLSVFPVDAAFLDIVIVQPASGAPAMWQSSGLSATKGRASVKAPSGPGVEAVARLSAIPERDLETFCMGGPTLALMGAPPSSPPICVVMVPIQEHVSGYRVTINYESGGVPYFASQDVPITSTPFTEVAVIFQLAPDYVIGSSATAYDGAAPSGQGI